MTATDTPELAPSAPASSRRAARERERLYRRLAKLAAIAGGAEFLGIMVLSLVPGADRPHTGLESGQLEHAIAYAIAGATIAVAFRTARARLLAALPFALAAVLLELLQIFIPDRGARVIDALASIGGLLAGVAVGVAGVALLAGSLRRRDVRTRR